jgi:hypothetical protein
MSNRPTPETDAAANESIVRVYETSKRLERQRDELIAACEWAVSEFGKHTRPSPLDKAIAAVKGGRDE